MTLDNEELQSLLTKEHYPRSSNYAGRWVIDNLMGPNPIWLAEALSEVMPLASGMRVLDLGCGSALTSIFLAKEFDVEVWATDLWVRPTENMARIAESGAANTVHPVYAEAHQLPFAENFFDAAVSYDAYHYFGTDECYLSYFKNFIKPGGLLGIVCPGRRLEPQSDPLGFHSPGWWRRHWDVTGQGDVVVDHADMLPNGYDDWLDWALICNRDAGLPEDSFDVPMLRDDTEKSLGFTRIAAHRVTD